MSQTTDFTVTGMTCEHCVASVTEEVQEIAGVTDVQVDLASGGLRVTSEQPVSEADVEVRRRRGRLPADMNAPTRVAGFLVGVAAVFGIAYAVGGQVGAVGATADVHASDGSSGHASADGHVADGHSSADSPESSNEVPGGLMVSSNGYTLALVDSVAQAGRGQPIAFVIDGPDGPVTAYDVEHEKRLHFIAVRRDFTGFQHVHPDARLGRHLVHRPRPDARTVAGLRRLQADRRRRRDARGRPLRPRPGGRSDAAPGHARREGRRLHRHPRRGPRRGRALDARAEGREGRPSGHRPAALPRRLRAPRRAARWRPRLPARPPRR